MEDKKRIYESDVMVRQHLRLVIGNVPNPDPDNRNRSSQLMIKSNREIEGTVKRIITHLEED